MLLKQGETVDLTGNLTGGIFLACQIIIACFAILINNYKPQPDGVQPQPRPS